MRRKTFLIVTSATALAIALSVTLPQAAAPDDVTPPPVPANLDVPAGFKAFLGAHALGTQDYICLPSGATVMWTFFGPQATLFDDRRQQEMTHFLSPNPAESGLARATWQHSRDTSSVWAAAIASSSDPDFVAPRAIPWLLLRVVGAQYGPRLGDKLTPTTFIHRVNTAGGIAPATGCAVSADVGKRALVPYETDYIFYRE